MRFFFLLLVSFLPIAGFAEIADLYDATYYSDAFEGQGTANGDIFSQEGYSAALCEIPLGQWVHVMYGATGVVVGANDRPNCARHPELIDLSRKAFQMLAPLNTGKVSGVRVTPIGTITPGIIRKDIDVRTFESLGIQLHTSIPNLYFAGESILLEGSVIDAKKNVIVYLSRIDGSAEQSELISVRADGTFRGVLTFPKVPGKYTLILASGNSFKTTISSTISLISPTSLQYPLLPNIRDRIALKVDQKQIVLPQNIWGDMLLSQDSRTERVIGNVLNLENLSFRSGMANISLTAYRTTSISSLDRNASIPQAFSGNVLLDRTHVASGENRVRKTVGKRSVTIRFRVPSDVRIRSQYYVTTPLGDVLEYTFPNALVSEDAFLKAGQSVVVNIPLPDSGTYLVEAVQENGLAYFNIPVIRGMVWNVIDPLTSEQRSTIRKNSTLIRNSGLKRINDLRASLGRPLLIPDDRLTKIAQLKAEDMAKRNYFGHKNPEGLFIHEFAKKQGLDPMTTIFENIAYGEGMISDLALQDGLEESGSHRYAMLLPKVQKVGIGYARNGEKSYLVQVFGE